MSDAENSAKGMIIQRVLEFVEERFGKQALDELKEPKTKEKIGLPLEAILSSPWYPMESYQRLLEVVTEMFLDGDPSRCAEIGRFALERDLKAFFPALIEAQNLDTMMSAAPQLWRQYRSYGELRVVVRTENSAVIEVTGVRGSRVHDWYMLYGGTPVVLELLGRQNVRTQALEGLEDGSERFVLRFDWDD